MIQIFIVLATIIFVILGIYAYYGGFSKTNIKQETVGGETIVYKEVLGNYKQTMDASNEVYDYLLHDLKIETYKGIGVFYDNPREVSEDKLRSEVGCIIESKDIALLNESECKYKIKTLAVKPSITTELTFKGKLSIFIGFLKIYPAIEAYIKKHELSNDGPLIEIYDTPKQKTIYQKIL